MTTLRAPDAVTLGKEFLDDVRLLFGVYAEIDTMVALKTFYEAAAPVQAALWAAT